MQDKRLFFSLSRYAWPFILLLTIFGVYCFIKPLVLSIDSVYGFLAYKGSLFFHSFNVIQDIPAGDVGKLNPVFVSWWSPGQWLLPGLLNYIFGIRLGVAAIMVTLAALFSGFFGYYRVFTIYKFSPATTLLALLVIFSSSTLYYCFIVYQGGEILEFGLFPWFLLYVIQIRKISWWNLVVASLMFLLCFLAKTTLVLYCTLVLLARVFQLGAITPSDRSRFLTCNLRLLLPALLCLVFIPVIYLSRGPRPVLIHHFEISVEGILVPLTSPLSSILSIQQWIKRVETLLSVGSLTGRYPILLPAILYLLVFIILLRAGRYLLRSKKINFSYKNMLFVLYAGLLAFFLFAYAFNANIDTSSRHFKLMGYLFVPGFIAALQARIKAWLIYSLVILFCLVAVTDIFYLKEKWTKDRYISINYFYRNCDPPGTPDKLDKTSYEQLLELDQQVPSGNGEPVVFFVESTADIAIDLRHPVILQVPGEDIHAKVYRKSRARLFICISKSTLSEDAGILEWKFPDYRDFEPAAETGQYWFLKCDGGNKPYTGSYR